MNRERIGLDGRHTIRARPPGPRRSDGATVNQRGLVDRAREGDHDAFAVLAAIARLDAAARLMLIIDATTGASTTATWSISSLVSWQRIEP